MSKKVSKAGKELLVNTIRSVDYQNRVREEKECWKSLKPSPRRKVFNDELCGQSRNTDPSPRSSHSSRNHDLQRGRSRSSFNIAEERERNRRLKEFLQKRKEVSGQDRWQNSGFRELYPQDGKESTSESSSENVHSSASSSSSSSSGEDEKIKHKSKKHKKHHRSSSKTKGKQHRDKTKKSKRK
jgi:hypothetical protein